MRLPDVPNYMLYRLTWNAERNKFDKRPCRLDGSSLAEREPIPLAPRHAITVPDGCALGLWLTAELNLFFIDLDECVTDGQLAPDAARIAAPFVTAGCFFEGSSSGRGAHIIGRYTGVLPAHSNKRPKVHKYEFYTRDRGIALSPGATQGDASVDATGLLLAMLPDVFPPRTDVTVLSPVGERRAEWRGPEDDDELLRRALAARGSPAAIFGNRVSFADLWAGQCEKNNESDMALASHLAFWTGCDVERIERLMRRSGLLRPKWNEHRTYLRDITITHACATTQNVYREPERRDTAAVLMGAPETDWNTVVEQVVATINNCGTYAELMDRVVPTIPPMGIPPIRAERIVTALRKRLELFDSKPPVAQLRQLICPPVVLGSEDTLQPRWFAGMAYVMANDRFYNTMTGSTYTADGFRAEYNRFMPFKPNGDRDDPVKAARDRWNIVTVDDLQYRPDQPAFFEYAGLRYANLFRASSMPEPTTPSAACQIAIQQFQEHLYLLANRRNDVYLQLLMWLAHNVQHPGHKIRWSPLVKGVPGDGKSLVGDLMRACIGDANVKITSNATLTNSGGFTDWATGKAVNFIEEIRLESFHKHNLYNAMKIFIGDTVIDLNRKGRASGDSIINVTNHWANSNYSDAMPMDDGDRRWLIVFTPYHTIQEAVAAKGLQTVEELVAHFRSMGASMKAEPGAWRAWMLGIDLSSFAPDARSIDTIEKEAMRQMSSDAVDQLVEDVLQRGGHGVTKDVFSSSCLAGAVQIANGGERLPTRQWNSLLVRLGYQQVPKTVWWGNTAHRVWVKRPMENDDIRIILENTK